MTLRALFQGDRAFFMVASPFLFGLCVAAIPGLAVQGVLPIDALHGPLNPSGPDKYYPSDLGVAVFAAGVLIFTIGTLVSSWLASIYGDKD